MIGSQLFQYPQHPGTQQPRCRRYIELTMARKSM
jgi:hypothetical protein